MLDAMRRKLERTAIPVIPLKITAFATTGQGIGVLESDFSCHSTDKQGTDYKETFNLLGIKVFLWNAIPGEIVTKFLILNQKSHFIEGIALEFTSTSPSRVTPKDPQYLSTSPWQILSPVAELEAKRDILSSLFHHLNLHHQIEPEKITQISIHQSKNNYFYRNKMEYSLYFDHQSAKIQLAVHHRGSHRKLPITTSSIEIPNIFQAANQIVETLNREHQDARKYQSLLLRASQDGTVQGGLLENGKPHPIFPNLTDSLLSHTYSYSPNGFFQINLPIYEQALIQVKQFLSEAKTVLDLYAGVGTIGLSVAREKDLTLVEVNGSAFRELQANTLRAIQETKNSRLQSILAKSEEILDLISSRTSVILDPPRAGCGGKLIQKLCEIKPEKIVYLSCNPTTQVRDLGPLLDFYHIESIQGFNFFPHTPHIESLVLLTRRTRIPISSQKHLD